MAAIRRARLWLGGLGAIVVVAIIAGAAATGAFTSPTIDVGIVVSDVEKEAAFLKDALGMTELKGFSVGAEVARDAGLTDNQPLAVRVFAPADEPRATRIKIMAVPGVKSAKADHAFIHSTLGPAYLTVHVADITAAVARAKKAGATIVPKGPHPLAGTTAIALVRDPDGNLWELVGPMK
jgi:catechol 2,3-dioxygenase-like lactoylglutathione lyase family enzyme